MSPLQASITEQGPGTDMPADVFIDPLQGIPSEPVPRCHPFNLAEWVGGGHALIIDDPVPYRRGPTKPDPELIAAVWYHRTSDAAEKRWPVVPGGVLNDLHWRKQQRIMSGAAALIKGAPFPAEAIDITNRSFGESWSAERLEAELPGYTEFSKWADANMPHNPETLMVAGNRESRNGAF